MMWLPSFLTGRDCCVVADRVWCRSCLAVFQQLQGPLPILAQCMRTDGCVVGGRVRSYLLGAHTL